jgi:hypothetical protein
MTQEVIQTETGEVLLGSFDLLEGTSASTRAKTTETFLELLGARVRNPKYTKRLSGGMALIFGILFGPCLAVGLYSTTPRIISESKSNRTAARCCLCVDPASRMLIQPCPYVIRLYSLKFELTGATSSGTSELLGRMRTCLSFP